MFLFGFGGIATAAVAAFVVIAASPPNMICKNLNEWWRFDATGTSGDEEKKLKVIRYYFSIFICVMSFLHSCLSNLQKYHISFLFVVQNVFDKNLRIIFCVFSVCAMERSSHKRNLCATMKICSSGMEAKWYDLKWIGTKRAAKKQVIETAT